MSQVAVKLFPQTLAAAPGGTGRYGLLIVAHPDWTVAAGTTILVPIFRRSSAGHGYHALLSMMSRL